MGSDVKIEIRHSEPADAEAVSAIYGSPGTFAGTLQLPCPSTAMWAKRLAELPEGFYSYVAVVGGDVVGQLGLMTNTRRARRKHAAEIGMGVRDDYWGKGVGSALVSFAIDAAENWLNVSRLELNVYTDNERAIALYTKHGFEKEGEMRAFAFRNGRYVDALMMARVRAPND
jgi:putative acetyltransferase